MKNIKICHMSSVHQLFDTRVFYKECKTLLHEGFDVSLVVQHKVDEEIEGIKIIGVGKPKSRIERMTKTVTQVYKRALEVDADLYHFHDPELLFVGLKLKRKGKKVIYDVHEDVPRQILSKEWIARPLRNTLRILCEEIENYAARKFDYIITATPCIKDRFLKLQRNVVDVNNFPMLQEFCKPEADCMGKEEKGKFICYVGGITRIRGALEMVRAMRGLECKLLLAGTFQPEQLRHECAMQPGWENVIELGFVNRKDLGAVLEKSSAGVVLYHPEPNHINAQPNKMFEYMAAGLPVVASNFPLWKEIVESNNCGICVDPLNVEEITKAIKWLIENPEKAKEMGANGRKAVEGKYNWGKEAEKLIAIYRALLS
jgi:glycosyltransferase involved in cell wall biosynthesis